MGTHGNRRSKIELEECINIGIKVLEEYNYIIGLQQFRNEYQNALNENNIITPTDSRTITSDIKKIEDKIRKENREILLYWESNCLEEWEIRKIDKKARRDRQWQKQCDIACFIAYRFAGSKIWWYR